MICQSVSSTENRRGRPISGSSHGPMRIGRNDRDGRLVESLRLREAGAAERLVTAYHSRAYRLAIGITANAEDAEEVVQDAFMKAITKIDTFRGESAFGSWLYRIVANSALGKARRRHGPRIALTLDQVLPLFHADGQPAAPVADWSAIIDDPSRRIQVRLAVSAAIEALPAYYRAAMVLRDVEGWTCAEIAEALSLSVGTVKSRVHRARLFIRKRLAEALSFGEPLRSFDRIA
jgi:RNA polymerase sigma-70 factor, ECF subfamily